MSLNIDVSWFQSIRDELLSDGTVTEKVTIEATKLDSIEGKDSKEIEKELDKIARLLENKLSSKKVNVDDEFIKNLDSNIRGEIKGKKAKDFLLYSMVLDDGQVLTAVSDTKGKLVRFSKPQKIIGWLLNKKDISKFIYGESNKHLKTTDNSEVSSKLAKIIERTHAHYIAKNPLTTVEQKIKKLKKEIEEIEIDVESEYNQEQEKIKALQAEYNPREAILGTNPVAGGDAQATDVRRRNEEIKKELKKLGGEIPKDIEIELPKSKPQTQQYIITLLEDDMMKYGKDIIEAFKKDRRLKDIYYRFQFENDRGVKKTVGGIGGITLDSIDAKNIAITLANEDDGESDAIKEVMVGIITKVSKDIDLREYSDVLANLDSRPKITSENIAEFYPTLSDEEKVIVLNKFDVMYNDRFVKVYESLSINPDELRKNSRVIHGENKMFHVDHFGVKDTLSPTDEYIQQIKNSESYKKYLRKEPISKDIMKTLREKLLDKGLSSENSIKGSESINRVMSKNDFSQRDIDRVSHKDNKITKEVIMEVYNVDFSSKTNKEGERKVREYLGIPQREKPLKKEVTSEDSSVKLGRDIKKFHTKIIGWKSLSGKNVDVEHFSKRLLSLDLPYQEEHKLKDKIVKIEDYVEDRLFEERKNQNTYEKSLDELIKDADYKNARILETKRSQKNYDKASRLFKKKFGEKAEKEIGLMDYAYNGLGKSIKEIFDVMVEKHGEGGKYLFLEFAERNKENKKFFNKYMNTSFMEWGTPKPSYNFDKFNSITDLNDYEKALDDLVEQLKADGTVDANEDKLNKITLKFADMMMGK